MKQKVLSNCYAIYKTIEKDIFRHIYIPKEIGNLNSLRFL